MKVAINIIILNVLVCFVLNNLLFTYATEKQKRIVVICETDESVCCMDTETGETCCMMAEECCARVPVQSAHLNFSVIMGLEKENQPSLRTPELSNFSLSQIDQAAELSEGHLSSLIKPPAVS